MIKVFIAEDHALMREGLRRIIDEEPGLAMVGEASDGWEAAERLEHIECDLVIMDMSMPRIGGIELIGRIKRMRPGLPVLVMSMHDTGRIVAAAMKAGADGYITKNTEPGRLISIIRTLAGGGSYVEPLIANRAFVEGGNRRLPHELLTEREGQIMRMIVAGKSTSQIGHELFLSPKTVSTHKKRILEKMNLNNASELVRYALDHHLCECTSPLADPD